MDERLLLDALGITKFIELDPSLGENDCPFERSSSPWESWCVLEDGVHCDRTNCYLDKYGAVFVRSRKETAKASTLCIQSDAAMGTPLPEELGEE